VNKALIIIDMLNDFIMENGALYCGKAASDIVARIKDKLELARKNNDVVIFLCDAHKSYDKEFQRFPKHAVIHTVGAQIINDLSPVERGREYVIKKTRYSGFYNTNLNVVLKLNNITHAEVVGVCTHICVMDTVGGLANRDIATFIDKSAVADFDKAAADAALLRMQSIYGTVVVP